MIRDVLRVLFQIALGITVAAPVLAVIVPIAPHRLGPRSAVLIVLLCIGTVMFVARRDRRQR
jgi:hypothetical protein